MHLGFSLLFCFNLVCKGDTVLLEKQHKNNESKEFMNKKLTNEVIFSIKCLLHYALRIFIIILL